MINATKGSLIYDNGIIPVWCPIYYLLVILYTFSTCAALHIHHICHYYVRPISIGSYTYVASLLYPNIYVYLLGPAILCVISYLYCFVYMLLYIIYFTICHDLLPLLVHSYVFHTYIVLYMCYFSLYNLSFSVV